MQQGEGGAAPPSPSAGATGAVPTKKLKTTNTNTSVGPSPFPKKLNLDPPTPQDGSVLAELQERLAQLPEQLLKKGVAFDIKTPHPNSFQNKFKTMAQKKPIVYLAFEGDTLDDPITLSTSKIGSTADGQRRYEEKYEKKGKVGNVIVDWNKYDAEALDIIDSCIQQCYEVVAAKFPDGFSNWIKTATVQDCHDWEKGAGGGLSIFFVHWMHSLLEHGGKSKRGVVKTLHLRTIEMGFQLYYNILNGAQFEQLHYDPWDYILDNQEQVRKSAMSLKNKIMELLEGAQPKFRQHSNSVSWEPNPGLNSRQELERKFSNLEDKEICNMTVEDIENAVNLHNDSENEEGTDEDDDPDSCLNYFFEKLTNEKLGDIKGVPELVECIFGQIDNNREMKLVNLATELFCDFFWGVTGSKLLKLWHDPYGEDRPTSDDGYNASNLNHKKAREKHQATIQDLKNTVDKCVEDGSVYIALMDRMKTAYESMPEDFLQSYIEKQGFKVILRFGKYATAYVYKSNTHKCLGLLLVHHAVSKAFTSRAPYAKQGPVRGRAAVEDNSMAAVTALLIHAVMKPLRDESNDFQPTDKFLGNPVTAYAMIMYILKRWHLWDSQVAVLFGKDVLAPGTDQLDPKFGLEQKFPNENARGSSSFKESERIALLLSRVDDNNTEEKLEEALDLLTRNKKKRSDGTVIHGEESLAVLQNTLVENGDLYKALLKKFCKGVVDEQDEIQQRNEETKRRKKEAKQALIAKMRANNEASK